MLMKNPDIILTCFSKQEKRKQIVKTSLRTAHRSETDNEIKFLAGTERLLFPLCEEQWFNFLLLRSVKVTIFGIKCLVRTANNQKLMKQLQDLKANIMTSS